MASLPASNPTAAHPRQAGPPAATCRTAAYAQGAPATCQLRRSPTPSGRKQLHSRQSKSLGLVESPYRGHHSWDQGDYPVRSPGGGRQAQESRQRINERPASFASENALRCCRSRRLRTTGRETSDSAHGMPDQPDEERQAISSAAGQKRMKALQHWGAAFDGLLGGLAPSRSGLLVARTGSILSDATRQPFHGSAIRELQPAR